MCCHQIDGEEECGAATAASRLLRSPVVCLQTLAHCSLSSNESEKHKLETAHFQSKSCAPAKQLICFNVYLYFKSKHSALLVMSLFPELRVWTALQTRRRLPYKLQATVAMWPKWSQRDFWYSTVVVTSFTRRQPATAGTTGQLLVEFICFYTEYSAQLSGNVQTINQSWDHT